MRYSVLDTWVADKTEAQGERTRRKDARTATLTCLDFENGGTLNGLHVRNTKKCHGREATTTEGQRKRQGETREDSSGG